MVDLKKIALKSFEILSHFMSALVLRRHIASHEESNINQPELIEFKALEIPL